MELDQFGGSLGGPIASNRTFFFASFEGLRQTTGLSFTEAVPSDEARRRILAGEPSGRAAGQSAARTQAVAPLLAGFPESDNTTSNPLLALATLNTTATQKENSLSIRVDHRLTDSQSVYLRYLFSDGDLEHARSHGDSAARPREAAAAERRLQPSVAARSNIVNEFKVGYNKPTTSATAFGDVAGYDPVGVSLSGTVTSSSIDARGTTGIARSGLLIRATSASSTTGSIFDPYSLSFSDALTWTKGGHTFKFGGEYRQLQSDFQFLGSTEITYNSVTDFIDNRPNAVAVALDSPVFSPQQYYLIGYMQDSWRASDRLTLELGLRYDFYSVVKEKNGNAKPFFIEENDFSSDPDNFYNPDKNNFAPRLSAVYRIDDKTVLRTGFGLFYGPGQFEDRIQPIENAIERRRVGAADIPAKGLQYPVPPSVYLNALSIRGYTHNRPDEYNMQYGASVSRELPGEVNLTIGYTGSRGKDMFLRGVANTLDFNTRTRQQPTYGQIDYKTSGCVDGLVINGQPLSGCGRASYDALQLSATRRFRAGFTGGVQYQYSRNKGTTQGSNEAATSQNTFDYDTEYGTNPQDIPHTFNGSLVYLIPGEGLWRGGWRVGGILNARSGVPINVTISRADNATVNGADGDEHSRRQQPRHAAARRRSGRRSVSEGWRALAQSGGVHDTAARHVRQPGAQRAARARVRAARHDVQQGLPVRAESVVPDSRRDLQPDEPSELRKSCGQSCPAAAPRCAVHRRAGRHFRLHARSAESHSRPRHRPPDADFAPILVLRAARRKGRGAALFLRPLPSSLLASHSYRIAGPPKETLGLPIPPDSQERRFLRPVQRAGDRAARWAPEARGDARARAGHLGQSRRDQGGRAQVRPPDASDHPAPQHARSSRQSIAKTSTPWPSRWTT